MRLPAIFLIAVSPLVALAQGDDDLHIPRPQGIDDAAWSRLKAEFGEEKGEFARFLEELDRTRVNPKRDDPADVLKKLAALRTLVTKHEALQLGTRTRIESIALNKIGFECATDPRLSGRIVKMGDPKAADFSDLAEGDFVRLGEGSFLLSEWTSARREFADIAFTGAGPDKTTIHLSMAETRRVRFENLTVDCGDMPCLQLTRGGTAHLKNCRIFNFNSGAGGSNGIFGVNSVLLVEDCEFEGLTGRAGKGGNRGGDAFDLRGDNLLFLRRCKFVNCAEILRASFPVVMDECTQESTGVRGSGVLSYAGAQYFTRKSSLTVNPAGPTTEFERATDDPAFIQFALGKQADLDPLSRKIAEDLDAPRNLAFLAGLLRHADPAVRKAARDRFAALTGEPDEPPAPQPGDLDDLVKSLDSGDPAEREKAAGALLKAGEAARSRLEKAAAGEGEPAARARELLADLARNKELDDEIHCASKLKWLEDHRDSLTWDGAAGRYVEKK